MLDRECSKAGNGHCNFLIASSRRTSFCARSGTGMCIGTLPSLPSWSPGACPRFNEPDCARKNTKPLSHFSDLPQPAWFFWIIFRSRPQSLNRADLAVLPAVSPGVPGTNPVAQFGPSQVPERNTAASKRGHTQLVFIEVPGGHTINIARPCARWTSKRELVASSFISGDFRT